jgi:beta-N-acetylglucosaminidase
LAGGFIVLTILIGIGTFGNAYLKEATNGKPIEKWTLDEISGKNQLEAQFEQTATENEALKIEVRQLRTPAVSRGESEYLKQTVIAAIDNNLGGILKGKGKVFYDAGKSRHVNPMMMAAISIHETANGTSKVLKACNNVGGINWSGDKNIPHKGRYRVFKTVDDSIYNLAYILDNHYIRQQRTSIETIGAKFCPIDDPDNMKYGMDNSTWVPMVTKNYVKILDEVRGETS